MEKASRYKARPKLEYSSQEEKIIELRRKLVLIRRTFEDALEVLGQTKALTDELRRQVEVDNLKSSPELLSAFKELLTENMQIKGNIDRLNKLHEATYRSLQDMMMHEASDLHGVVTLQDDGTEKMN